MDSRSPDIELVELAPEVVAALADGDLAAAEAVAPIPLTPYLVDPECVGVWCRRRDQIRADPGDAAWITRIVFDRRLGGVVGRAGFHGPPNEDGMVEVGYATDPAFRRRGYARAALEALLARARREPTVRIVRASIRPDNHASLGLIEKYPFTPVGEQWDAEDGLETIYELAVDDGP